MTFSAFLRIRECCPLHQRRHHRLKCGQEQNCSTKEKHELTIFFINCSLLIMAYEACSSILLHWSWLWMVLVFKRSWNVLELFWVITGIGAAADIAVDDVGKWRGGTNICQSILTKPRTNRHSQQRTPNGINGGGGVVEHWHHCHLGDRLITPRNVSSMHCTHHIDIQTHTHTDHTLHTQHAIHQCYLHSLHWFMISLVQTRNLDGRRHSLHRLLSPFFSFFRRVVNFT